MIYIRAKRRVGTIGWLVANVTGKYGWTPTSDSSIMIWWFENSEDAVAFRLKFGV